MTPARFTWLAIGLLAALAPKSLAQDARQGAQAWTVKEAYEQLVLNPRDPFLQYVAMQLARREQQTEDWAARIGKLIGPSVPNPRRAGAVDLFDLFSGALAVQESLQLETMRGTGRRLSGESLLDVGTLSGPTLEAHPWTKMLRE